MKHLGVLSRLRFLLLSFTIFGHILISQFIFIQVAVAKSCLPTIEELELEPTAFQCRTEKDCVLIDEGCRSCNTPIAVNADHAEEFNEADENLRVEKNCLTTCEACDQSSVVVSCVNGLCTAQATIEGAAKVEAIKAPSKAEAASTSPKSKKSLKKQKKTKTSKK